MQLKNDLCYACKKQLPKDYEYAWCCTDPYCGCNGLPTEPWVCGSVCRDLAWCFNYRQYRYMWE